MDKIQLLESVLGSGQKANRDYYQFMCPFHIGKNGPKLGVSIGTGGWKCWVCPAKGSSVSGLFRKLQVRDDKIQLSRQLWKEKVQFKYEPIQKINLPSEYLPLWQESGSFFLKKAKNYLIGRGLREIDIYKHRIGYCESGKFDDMIIFPSYDQECNINFFSTRTFNQLSKFRFKILENINKDEILIDDNQINWQEPIVVVEGKLDAIAIRRNAYPLSGKKINEKFKQKVLEEQTPELIFAIDGDALHDAIMQSDFFLKNGIKVKIAEFPTDEDPSSLGYLEAWKFIKNAIVLTENDLWNYKIKQKLK